MAEILIRTTSDEGGAVAADIIASVIRSKPDAVLGLATGSTPLTVYTALAAQVSAGLDVSEVRGFALDEYIGLPVGHPESYRAVIEREVIKPLGLNPAAIRTPDATPDLLATAGDRYETAIREAGGVDVQILGIGSDGHIGFNEPGSSLGSLTRVKTLSQQTRQDNARFFDNLEQVPLHCLTQGVGTILRARHLILLAFGEQKADALAAAVEGPLSAEVPGSAIQLHPHVTVIVDEAAASRLARADYYRFAESGKPSWQGY